MRKSRILQKLRAGQVVSIGQSWIVPHWKVVEIMGLLGFDGVWLEHEHSDFTLGEISRMILAARAHDMDSLVRVERSGYNALIKPLEAGATGVIIPHVKSADEVAGLVDQVKYYPPGHRGAGGSVDSHYGTAHYGEYSSHVNAETLVALIIETKQAVEEIDAIAALEGVELLIVGFGDLCQSHDLPVDPVADVVLRANERVAEAAAKHGKWWGTPVIRGSQQAQELIDQGARVLQWGSDQTVLTQGFGKVLEEIDRLKLPE